MSILNSNFWKSLLDITFGMQLYVAWISLEADLVQKHILQLNLFLPF